MPSTANNYRGPAPTSPPNDRPVGWVGPLLEGRVSEHRVKFTGRTVASPYYRAAWYTIAGKRQHRSLGTNYRTAAAKAADIEKSLVQATEGPGALIIDDLTDAWLAAMTPHWSLRHAADQRAAVARWVEPEVGDLPVSSLDRTMVARLLADPAAPSARRQLRATLGGLVGWGYANQWLGFTRDQLLPPTPRTSRSQAGRVHGQSRLHVDVKRIPSPDDCRRLAEAARVVGGERFGAQWWLMVAVAASTGVRQGELFALRPADVDLTAGKLRVERQVLRANGVTTQEDRPKWGRTRTANLPSKTLWGEPLAAPLRAYMAGKAPDGLLFPNSRGEWLNGSNWGRRVLKPARRAAGWRPGWTGHSLRHAYCSELLARGVAPQDIADSAGHRDTSVTLSLYVQATAGVAGRLNAAF
jgi:integrase